MDTVKQQAEVQKSRISKVPDEYGFLVKKEILNNDVEHNTDKELKRNNARIEKWRKMMPNLQKLMANKDSMLKRRLRKGIPDGIRVKVWPILAECEKFKHKDPTNFKELVTSNDFPYENDILQDLGRTFPDNYLFKDKNPVGITSLNNILKALSIKFKDMGYCQGLNFVAAAFLLQMNDEDAFWML